jgi:REP-associated tyrosine transposase
VVLKYDSDIHHRRSIRLKGYDYSQIGAYFITIFAQNRKCLFGKVVDSKIELNNAGWMIQTVWDELPQYYQRFDVDVFQIMPNHIHGIIVIVGVEADPCTHPDDIGQPQGIAPTMSLPDIVHRFKSLTTKRYIDGVKQNNWAPFSKKLWQRNYYDHIIRNEKELNGVREYIMNNPMRW